MNDRLPASERVFDRDDELECFRAALGAGAVRIVTVCAGKGAGKSSLLERFEEEAVKTAATVRFKVPPNPQPITVAEQLARFRDGSVLDRFVELNDARSVGDHTAFELPPPPPVPKVTITVENSHIEDSSITGANFNGPWPDGHERVARRKCLEAFVDDLRGLSHTKPVVLLLDQVEPKAEQFASWYEDLVARLIDETNPYGSFVLVLASNEPVLPLIESQLGTRRAALVERIVGLSEWREEHIQMWLRFQRLDGVAGLDSTVRDLLSGGGTMWGLQKLAGVVHEMRGEAHGTG